MNINFDDYSIGKSIINNIHRECGKLDCDIKIMEVCGTHTRSIHKYAVPSLLPANLKLISGPGCPICVTPQEYISQGVKLAVSRDVIITTFSDVLRVPSSLGSLADARSRGADIRTVYSPLESLEIAKSSDKEVVFIGVGFETTAATIALTLINAKNYGIQNFSILNYLKSMPNALRAITYESPINGYICPGHVGSIIGNDVFNDLATERNIPMVMAGFNSLDILSSILMIINMINRGESGCRNLYKRAVKASGNIKGKNIISSVFDSDSSIWRGLSTIDNSGYKLSGDYKYYDARERFNLQSVKYITEDDCSCSDIITGKITPSSCKYFGYSCIPSSPIGPCMVSSEGACNIEFMCKGDSHECS